MSEKLKDALPCPFCGSTWIIKGERYFAMCVDCGATGPERNGDASRKKFVLMLSDNPELSGPDVNPGYGLLIPRVVLSSDHRFRYLI